MNAQTLLIRYILYITPLPHRSLLRGGGVMDCTPLTLTISNDDLIGSVLQQHGYPQGGVLEGDIWNRLVPRHTYQPELWVSCNILIFPGIFLELFQIYFISELEKF